MVTFDATGANLVFGLPDTIQLRKNGDWLARVDNGEAYNDPAGTVADTYIARTRPAGIVIDFACTAE